LGGWEFAVGSGNLIEPIEGKKKFLTRYSSATKGRKKGRKWPAHQDEFTGGGVCSHKKRKQGHPVAKGRKKEKIMVPEEEAGGKSFRSVR